ncbi:aspartate/glutamate racemase family protein [Ectopseudomonas mendocina]|uniref:Aspartate/glutamate racemase family protein n=1 Tax=Ectopseudomonas mendocina TaxID=300 RepID=A0ABZ2RGS1_ECTME
MSSLYKVPDQCTQAWYGETVGIIVLDARYPCVPGNVANASSYSFPVRFQRIEGGSIERLLYNRDPELAKPFIEAALALQEAGVKAVSGACGFMALFQKQVAAALDIPVLLSSLLQIPFIYSVTGKPVGILTADASALTPRHFEGVGVSPDIPLEIIGLEDCPEFSSSILREKGTLDSSLIEAEVVEKALQLQRRNPGIGAILLECSDLPPYASAIQRATGLPVFDYIGMIEHVGRSFRARPYQGFM